MQEKENEVFSLSKEQLDEIRERAREKVLATKHTWRQKGFWLVCKTCENTHATWIGKKRMTGEKKSGEPILEDLE